MSTRNIRKMREKLKKVDDADVPLEDFEPAFAKKSQFGFDGLLVKSESEDEGNHSENPSDNSLSEHETVIDKTEKQKTKKKNKHKKNKQNIVVSTPPEAENYDEIDRVVAEVNMLLGEPEQAPLPEVSDNKDNNNPLKVVAKHINVEYEMMRLFGPGEDEERRNRNRQRPRLLRRIIVQPNDNFVFSVRGLKMSLKVIKDGIKYFVFEHGPGYVKNMKALIKILERKYFTGDLHEPHVFTTDTIEAVLENNDIFYAMEALDMGRPTLDETICFLQGTFHPMFNFSDDTIRLEYKYVENRMFHVALLKYLHLLTNKACHRTALEIAKLLLNLDPSDPLAIILIIDTLALRAREHQWFLELYKHWEHNRGAKHLFHMLYSYAMSLFHVATKNHDEDGLAEADKELQKAILQFPLVVTKLIECASQKNEEVSNCELFKKSENMTRDELKGLILLYSKFTWPRWREPNVWKWFIKNTTAVVQSYKNDASIRARGDEFAKMSLQLFIIYPLAIKRHLNTIMPMSQLLVDGAVPIVERSISHNPYPDQGESIDTNQYYSSWGVATSTIDNLFRMFIGSMAPEPYRGG